MTKRFADHITRNSSKKSKVEDDLDNLWDDDLDDDAFDRLATQVCDEDINLHTKNESILPTYNTFKQPSRIVISSTQLESSFIKQIPSTSKIKDTNCMRVQQSNSYQLEIIGLKHKCEEKEGEATVLRSQLKQVKANFQQEQDKKQHEWTEKLNQKEKQIKTLKDQLDFKNLEIANLKQKITDVARRASLDITLNGTQSLTQQLKTDMRWNVSASPKKTLRKTGNDLPEKKTYSIQTVSEIVYPLKNLISKEFPLFDIHKDESYITKSNRQENSGILNNSFTSNQHMVHSKLKQTVISTKETCEIDDIYHSVTSLLSCSLEEMNSDCSKQHINKILCFTLQIIESLDELLKNQLLNSQAEEIQLLDRLYLTNCNEENELIQSDHLATKVGKCMYILSEILLCSFYLREVLLFEKPIQIDRSVELVNKYLNHQAHLLNRILSITTMIGQLRKGLTCIQFLIGTLKFLISICKINCMKEVSDIFFKVVKQIIFSRPSIDVMPHIIDLFMTGSQYTMFIESLCNKLPQSNMSASLKKGTVVFNEESCQFHVFVILLYNTLLSETNLDDADDSVLTMYSRLLCFNENVLLSNCRWIYYKEGKRCECLDQFYKLSVELVYTVLCKYKEKKQIIDCSSEKMISFFKCSIRVLRLLAFNSDDLTEKYITVFSQYRDIVHSMIEMQNGLQLSEDDLKDLEKLNISEDTFEISRSDFQF